MLCAEYGPVTVGWDGRRTYVNPAGCEQRVDLRTLVEQVRLAVADRRLLYLLGVPRGYVTTYKLYAKAVGTSPRGVGRLMAANPLPIILPCHRVVRSDMSLGGYTPGADVKRAILEFEGALCGGRPCKVVRPAPVADVSEALRHSLGLS